MTTRPTDEEIRAMRKWAYRNRGDIGDKVYQFAEAWLAERQTARNGVIINEREAFDVLVDAACEAINKIHKVGKKRFKADMTAVVKAVIEAQARAAIDQRQEVNVIIEDIGTCTLRMHNGDVIMPAITVRDILHREQSQRKEVTDEMVMLLRRSIDKQCGIMLEWDVAQASLQSIALPIKSVSDALNFLEEWAISGKTLHDDDIQRFHATVERIAPVEQSARVPDAKEPMTAQDEAYADGWNDCREAMLSTSPQPQKAVPDGWKLVPINADKVMRVAGEREWRHENLYRIWEAMLSAAPAYNGKKEG